MDSSIYTLWSVQWVARSTKNGHQIMVLFCSISSHSIWTAHNSDKICFLFQIIYLAQDARKQKKKTEASAKWLLQSLRWSRLLLIGATIENSCSCCDPCFTVLVQLRDHGDCLLSTALHRVTKEEEKSEVKKTTSSPLNERLWPNTVRITSTFNGCTSGDPFFVKKHTKKQLAYICITITHELF